MKHHTSYLFRISALILTIAVFISCGRKPKVDYYFIVDNEVYELKSGIIINNGETENGFDIDLRLYCENTKDFINFGLVSKQAESLSSMTYSQFDGSWVTGYSNGSYTNLGKITSGNLVVERSKDGYIIEFNGTDQYSNDIEVYFKGELSKRDENNLVQELPDYVCPDEIYEELSQYFPIYSGVNPPDMRGEYVSAPNALIYESYAENPDSVYFFSDRYLGFIYDNKQMNFYGKQYDSINNGFIEEVYYGVKITGDNDYFTCYYIEDGYYQGYYAQQSFIFSGKKTENGLENYHAAVVLLETSGHPGMPAKNSFRVLTDYDGLAETHPWLSKNDMTGKTTNNDSSFKMWIR